MAGRGVIVLGKEPHMANSPPGGGAGFSLPATNVLLFLPLEHIPHCVIFASHYMTVFAKRLLHSFVSTVGCIRLEAGPQKLLVL